MKFHTTDIHGAHLNPSVPPFSCYNHTLKPPSHKAQIHKQTPQNHNPIGVHDPYKEYTLHPNQCIMV